MPLFTHFRECVFISIYFCLRLFELIFFVNAFSVCCLRFFFFFFGEFGIWIWINLLKANVRSDRLKWKQWEDDMRNAGLRGRRWTVEKEKQK